MKRQSQLQSAYSSQPAGTPSGKGCEGQVDVEVPDELLDKAELLEDEDVDEPPELVDDCVPVTVVPAAPPEPTGSDVQEVAWISDDAATSRPPIPRGRCNALMLMSTSPAEGNTRGR